MTWQLITVAVIWLYYMLPHKINYRGKYHNMMKRQKMEYQCLTCKISAKHLRRSVYFKKYTIQ